MHKHGVVHRDLKPEKRDGGRRRPHQLIDFGIAMKEDARRLTIDIVAALAPPTIFHRVGEGSVATRGADIYALGVMLTKCLTGETPFNGSNPLAVMNERVLHDPQRARKLRRRSRPSCRRFWPAHGADPRRRMRQPPTWHGSWSTRSSGSGRRRARPTLRTDSFARSAGQDDALRGLALVPVVLFGLM